MMQEKLSSEQMVSFLKNVSELEASVYQQTEALRKVEDASQQNMSKITGGLGGLF